MTTPLLILYASHDGQTRKIVSRISNQLNYNNKKAILCDLSRQDVPSFLLDDAGAVLVVSPIRYGHHLKPVDRFLENNKRLLNQNRLGMISINLTARKPQKSLPLTNPYYQKWLKKHGLNPALQYVLAGLLDYSLYKWWEKHIIRLIMLLTDGPTNTNARIDYTDWATVDVIAEELAALSERTEKREVA